jgi:hypothetical protein
VTRHALVSVLSRGLNTSTFGSFTFAAASLGPLTLTTGSPGLGTDVAQDALLSYRILGEAGADNIVCTHAGTLQGILTSELDGGPLPGDLADVIRMNYVGLVQAQPLTGVGITPLRTVEGISVRGLGLVRGPSSSRNAGHRRERQPRQRSDRRGCNAAARLQRDGSGSGAWRVRQ